nr:PREDICTED: uroplakin-3b-like protein isoform X2 [Lepisosteus oculatus]
MALLTAAVLYCVSVWTVAGKVTSVEYTPEITAYNMAGRVTGTTMVMKQPRCYFDNQLLLPCTPDKCEIWLVAAVGSGIQNFDADKGKSTILSESPYPTAFTGSPPKNYYLTKVGRQQVFPCQQSHGIVYFRVGDEGNCTSANCNGILPAGSTVRVKYVLVDPASRNVTTETYWSQNITLYSSTDPVVIFDGIRQRSAGMIVITSILSVLLFLLLLLLIAGLIYANRHRCWKQHKEGIPAKLGSLRIKKYDTHNLQRTQPQESQKVQDGVKSSPLSGLRARDHSHETGWQAHRYNLPAEAAPVLLQQPAGPELQPQHL